MIRRVLTAFAAFIAFPVQAEAGVEEPDLRRHIEILASDDFQGRRPGTPGAALAADYIARQFAEVGLEPAGAGHFYLPVELVERSARSVRLSWRGIGGVGVWNDDALFAFGRETLVHVENAPMVFAGYAAGVDQGRELGIGVRGAVVLVLTGSPDPDVPIASFSERSRALGELGAAAVIGIADEYDDWDALAQFFRSGRTWLAGAEVTPVQGIVAYDAALPLLQAAGLPADALTQWAAAEDFVPSRLGVVVDIEADTAVRRYASFNVAGRLDGSGATGEAVLLMAHYDHLGLCGDEGAVDRICNGAVDNASGVAALIETARALAAGEPPVRDIVFVATTAEEMGLLGAEAFAANPPLPLEDIVAALNLDTIAIAPRGAPVGIVEEVATELGRIFHPGDEMNAFVTRQDGWALMRRDVPAIMAGGSFTDQALLGAFLESPYHEPGDEPGRPVELGGAVEDTLLHIALVRAFADPARFPTPAR